MNYRALGKTGLKVSEIGLGTAQLGGPSLIGGRYIGSPRIERKEALRILAKAYDSGINFYDTSDKYGDGEAERILGEAFSGKRDKVVLATKCGLTESGERCFERKYVRLCLENSLKNMKVDHVDVFQLTKPGINLVESGDIYETFAELKKEGKIKFSGVSTGSEEEALRLISDNKVDTLQVFYNLLYIRPNQSFINEAHRSGIGIIVRSPLSSGVLTGKYNCQTKFPQQDDRSLFLFGDILKSRVEAVNAIIKRYRLNEDNNVALLALNYLLSNKKISTVIPGVSKESQLTDILRVCAIPRMNEEQFARLEEFIAGIIRI